MLLRRSLRAKILLSQVGLLLLVLVVIDAFTLITLENAYLGERKLHYFTQANIMASTGGPYLVRKEPYLRYIAREFGSQAGARVMFLDAEGQVVVDSYGDPAIEGKALDTEEALKALEGGQVAGTHYFHDLGWVMYVAVPVWGAQGSRAAGGSVADGGTASKGVSKDGQSRPIPTGAVFLSASLSSVYHDLTQFKVRILSLSAVALILGIAASFLLARAFTHPLTLLRKAVQQIASGRWSHRVGLKGGDEIAGLAQAFDRMAEDLQRLDETRRAFVADASHELRTPLASIKALTEPMAFGKDLDPETYRELSRDVLSQIDRMQRLTESLLELARLENQLETGSSLKKAKVDLLWIGEEALEAMRPLAEQRGVTLKAEAPGSGRGPIPVVANVDSEAVDRILANLLDNAVKHTPSGGTVSLGILREGDMAVLRVSDTGEGIPKEQIPLVFQRFQRADRSRARRTGGTGLGLAITDRLVRLHGGEISVDSSLGKGSVFTVYIPIS